jgi:hypothetical protein
MLAIFSIFCKCNFDFETKPNMSHCMIYLIKITFIFERLYTLVFVSSEVLLLMTI